MKPLIINFIQVLGHFFGIVFYDNIKTKKLFIFHTYQIGGAEIVHLDILSALNYKPTIIFLHGTNELGLIDEYQSKANKIIVINRKRIIRHFQIGVLRGIISKSDLDLIFGIADPDFYNLISRTVNKIKIIDILHSYIAIDNAPDNILKKLSNRIVIDGYTKNKLKEKYIKMGLYNEVSKILFIKNSVNLPLAINQLDFSLPLRFLYVGRDTYEKRLNIIINLAQKIKIIYPEIIFTILGPDINKFKDIPSNCIFVKATKDRKIIESYYKKNHFILITSIREGFPLVLMEGMSYGLIPICTSVGGIPYIIKNDYSGILLNKINDTEIAEEAFIKIKSFYNNRKKLMAISNNSRIEAYNSFDKAKFISSYSQILN
jgi:glycosyltransferase involved in cell wall biosynthesis